MARTYRRDGRGRFSGGGGGSGKTAVKSSGPSSSVPKGTVAKGGMVARSLANTAGGGSRSTKVTGTPKAAVKAPAKAAPAKGSVADRKKALVRKVSDAALSGKKVSPGVRGYVKAQQSEKLRMEKTGKGSKAARRMAKK